VMTGGTLIAIEGVNFPRTNGKYEPELSLKDEKGNLIYPTSEHKFCSNEYNEYNDLVVFIGDGRARIVRIEQGNREQDGNPVYVIYAYAPPGVGTQDVRVRVEWNQRAGKEGRTEEAVLENRFSYYTPRLTPEVKDIVNIDIVADTEEKNVGPVRGGHQIKVTGTNFASKVRV